ncbi:MAG: cytochrome b, partial [Pseudomonadota bacterium]
MPLTNTDARYGSVTKVFHWLTALMIFTVIPLGVVAHNLPVEGDSLALKARLYSMHKTLGLAILFTALARILWAIAQPARPGTLTPGKKVETFLAATVHFTLYGALVLVPLLGWMTHAATEGFAPIWWPFGQNLPLVPDDPELAERFAHMHQFWERVMVAALLLHIVGALKHHVIDKDATLRRMWFGRTEASGSDTPHGATPALVAAAI